MLLIAAAVEAELDFLRAALEREPRAGLRLEALGVGPVEAALGAAEALRSPGLRAAIFIGTCGAFPGTGLSIGEAVVVRRSWLSASDAAAGHAYIPAPAAGATHGDPRLCAALAGAAGLPLVDAATVVAITRSAGHAQALAQASGTQVEHLEAFAFLRAAERAGVPAACVLGVSNEVGPKAHEEWKANADRASAAAAEALLRWLASPAFPPEHFGSR